MPDMPSICAAHTIDVGAPHVHVSSASVAVAHGVTLKPALSRQRAIRARSGGLGSTTIACVVVDSPGLVISVRSDIDVRAQLQLRRGVAADELEAHARMTAERTRRRRREHVRDAPAQAEQRAVGQDQADLGLFADRQQRFGADEQTAHRKILGLGFDDARRPVELDSTPTDESLVATAARICHHRKSSEMASRCPLCDGSVRDFVDISVSWRSRLRCSVVFKNL